MRLSKSALQMYQKCPYSYYLKYVKGIRGPPSDAMQQGIDFHDNADLFFDKVSLRELAEQRSIFGIERYIRSLLPEGLLYDHFSHQQTVFYINLNNKNDFIPIEREIKLDVEKITGKPAPDEILDVGIIDWIGSVDGKIILGEYKTGKYMSGINQELMMYKDLVEHTTEYKIDKLCAIYPAELYGTKLPSGIYYKSPSHAASARKKVAETKEAIRAGRWRSKHHSPLCAWCDGAEWCFKNEMEVK